MCLPLVVKDLSLNVVGIEGAAFLVIGLVLIWRVTAHRNDLEFARTSELRATNWALKHEIAERKKAEERGLQLAVEQERMRVFTAFIGAAAHDFMTPVSGILTSQYLARRATDGEKRSRHLDQIQYQAERIQMLVDALLDMSRLESGSEIDFRMTNMHMLLTTSCERVQDGIEEKHLELVIDLDKVKSNIYASAPELSCTFKKLLENAIQHTPDGGRIHLIAHEDAHKVIVDIRDTGEGIQPEVIPHIFDQFYRGDASRSTRTGGLGLGLTYVQRVVALHGGSIEVESTIGSGTTIRVLLPKNSPKAMPNPGIIGALSQQV
jgi:signal transduction histidine kinase